MGTINGKLVAYFDCFTTAVSLTACPENRNSDDIESCKCKERKNCKCKSQLPQGQSCDYIAEVDGNFPHLA